MLKNVFLLGLLCWVCVSHAKEPIVRESLGDAETFKVESGVEEQAAQRSVAGEKIKKKKSSEKDAYKASPTGEPDSEVRYWQYQE
jgi:hypothetical protein